MSIITPNTILLPINKENDDSYGEADNEELRRRGWSKKKKKKKGNVAKRKTNYINNYG